MKEFETFDSNIDWREPVDYIEPEEDIQSAYREAAVKFTRLISLAVSYIISQRDTESATYGVIFALGLSNIIDGKSMGDVAKELDVTCASISHHAKQARQFMGIAPSKLQKPVEDNIKKSKQMTDNG